MAPALAVALIVTMLGASLCGLSIVALRHREHSRARRFAGYAMLAAVLFVPIVVLAAFVGAMFAIGPESKATHLARGISEALNAGALGILIGLPSFVVWFVARRREAVARK